MEENWQSFLRSRGAVFDTQGMSSFGHSAEESTRLCTEGDFLCELGWLETLRIFGDQAEQFLQGQISCDVGALSPTRSALGAHCTPKGRVVANFRIQAPEAGHYLLTSHASVAGSLGEALQKYLVFFRAEQQLGDAEHVLVGLAGPGSREILQRVLGAAPQEADQCIRAGEHWVTQRDEAGRRFECRLQGSSARDSWDTLAEQAQPLASGAWMLLDIRAGLGLVQEGTREAFTPHMLNLPALGGVSFTKGCYTGQEVVARTQYLGKLKRRMFRGELRGAPPVAAGAELYDSDQGRAGTVVCALQSGADRQELLAVLAVGKAQSGKIFAAPQQYPLTILELPYALED